MKLDGAPNTLQPDPNALRLPEPLPLVPADVPVVYAKILRGLFEHASLPEIKAGLRAELGRSRSALDGVHAQLTKDLAGVYAACPEAHQWGDVPGVMQLAARHVRAGAGDEGWEALPGLGEFVERYGAVCFRRGVGILWEELTGNRSRWGAVTADTPGPYRGAAHSDFDFPAKVAWRAAWEEFLRDRFASLRPGQVAGLRVLCLSSKDPRRELPVYLRLGVRPENISAVEKDPEAAAELRRNLKVLGGDFGRVRVEEADLLSFLRGTTDRFDVISIDFHGCTGLDKVKILREVRTAPTHYVLINLEAAREKALGQKILRDNHYFHTNLEEVMALYMMESRGVSIDEETAALRDKREGQALAEVREAGGDLLGCLGEGHAFTTSPLGVELRRFEQLFREHGPRTVYGQPDPEASYEELMKSSRRIATPLDELGSFVRSVCGHFESSLRLLLPKLVPPTTEPGRAARTLLQMIVDPTFRTAG